MNLLNTGQYNWLAMKPIKIACIIFIFALAACVEKTSMPTPPIELTPYYYTPTINTTATPSAATATPLPMPTPTPIYHVVKVGETISAIALHYGVDPMAVQAANPEVNPNAMSVGIKLLIPPPSANTTLTGLSATLAPLLVGPLHCIRSREGGAWCFLNVKNEQDYPIENIMARVIIGNSQSDQLSDQLAYAPLNILYPGQSIPIAVYFSGPVPDPFQTSYKLVSALAVQAGDARYLQTKIENQQINIDANELTAQVSGDIVLADVSAAASRIWLVAVAFDDLGQVVGERRWENPNPLSPGVSMPFTLNVYSTSANIAQVELLAEALR